MSVGSVALTAAAGINPIIAITMSVVRAASQRGASGLLSGPVMTISLDASGASSTAPNRPALPHIKTVHATRFVQSFSPAGRD